MTLALRQKKFFDTRLLLAKAFAEKLKTEKFDSISIKDICFKNDISEATFFNYFPQKIDVVAYWLKIKLFKLFWFIINFQKNSTFTNSIEKTFELFAGEIKHPYIFNEVISLFKLNNIQIKSIEISSEELRYIHPECPDLDKINFSSLYDFFEALIDNKINENLLSKNVSKKTLVQFLITILMGVPLSTPLSEYNNIAEIYQKHLSLLWKIFQL